MTPDEVRTSLEAELRCIQRSLGRLAALIEDVNVALEESAVSEVGATINPAWATGWAAETPTEIKEVSDGAAHAPDRD